MAGWVMYVCALGLLLHSASMQGMLSHTLLKEASYLEGMHATAFNRICNQVNTRHFKQSFHLMSTSSYGGTTCSCTLCPCLAEHASLVTAGHCVLMYLPTGQVAGCAASAAACCNNYDQHLHSLSVSCLSEQLACSHLQDAQAKRHCAGQVAGHDWKIVEEGKSAEGPQGPAEPKFSTWEDIANMRNKGAASTSSSGRETSTSGSGASNTGSLPPNGAASAGQSVADDQLYRSTI